uniref:Fibronectin type-III domain-containing protein n=1 Tax=Xiphophorus couchianus TaxID=32473 RepID=A0A3B5N1D8_9TELE
GHHTAGTNPIEPLYLGFLSANLVCVRVSACVFTAVPAAPVNVSVTQLRAHSAMVTWNVPQGDTVIGYSISQQVRSAACVLIRSLCMMGKPGALPHLQVGWMGDEPAMEGLGMTPHLQTGELLIITTVLLLWAAVIALFCRQYDIIKDNDSNGTKEKAKSSPIYHNGAVRNSRVRHSLFFWVFYIYIYIDIYISI